MSKPPKKTPAAVREPIQVYLTRHDRALLDRVAAKAGLSRAEVLRNGLRRYGAEVLAEAHPILQFLDEMSDGWPETMPTDVAARHDEILADTYAVHRKTRKR
jgi:hypothetical protein